MKTAPIPVVVAILVGAASYGFAAEPGARELELVLTRNPELKKGAELYATCAACHGQRGEGVSDGTVPALAGQPYSVIAKQIVEFRSGRRGDARMVHFTDRSHLSFSQPIADVAAYIARLEPTAAASSSPGSSDTRGAMNYARVCERCHGALAEGSDDTSTPRLASQHFEYLAKQLDDAARSARPAMAEAHASISSALTADEMTVVVRYLASLSP